MGTAPTARRPPHQPECARHTGSRRGENDGDGEWCCPPGSELGAGGRRADLHPVGRPDLAVYGAGLDAGLRFVDGRHESAVANMADAWGRLTGCPGVALVTAGPGHTNALTGLATALLSESPMVLLSGGTNVPHVGKGGFQELDQVALAAPVCKAAWMATSPAAPDLVARAWRTALEGTLAFAAALASAEKTGSLTPPKHILNAPTRLMKSEGYGGGYIYDHDTEEGFSGQEYFPPGMSRENFYRPGARGLRARTCRKAFVFGRRAR